jgi:hypothetical protein
LFSICEGVLYKGQTALGSTGVGGFPRIAAANQQLGVVSGSGLYCYTTKLGLQQIIEFTNDEGRLPSFSGLAVLYDIWILPVTGSNQFFFSNTGDLTTIDAANFGAAQTNDSPIVEVAVLAEEIYFFCTDKVEIWDFTGNLTAPFALSQGRTYARGCAAQGSVVKQDNSLFWIGDDFTVYRSGSAPQDVGIPIVVDRIRACGTSVSYITGFAFNIEGHAFYGINLPSVGETYVYDCQTKEWAQWGTLDGDSPDPSVWQAQTVAGQGGALYAGSYNSGEVYEIEATSTTDGNLAIPAIFSAQLWAVGGVRRCTTVALQCVRGIGTPAVTPDPIVRMRYSDDGGNSWTVWRQASLGASGQSGYVARWNQLGLMRSPGRMFEFAVSDPVNFVAQGASYNEARVGGYAA